jgi:DNA-binding response OmpR family regulator
LGFTEADLAAILGVPRETACHWWSAQADGGPDPLPHGRTGRPPGSGRAPDDRQAQHLQGLIDARQAALPGSRRCSVRVLLIEDHKPLVRALKQGLEEEGFAVDTALDGEEGNFKARTAEYDVIILDLMLPKQDGLALLHDWRKGGLSTHVLVLTAKDNVKNKVRGLDLGADDHLTKPFQLKELLARLRALIRRARQKPDPVLRVCDLEIDTAARTVCRADQPIRLTPREFALLQFLAVHRGKVVTRSMIWEHLYDRHDEKTSNVVDVYIRYLRNKIDKGFDPPLILTRWGEGYLLRGEDP